MKRDEKGLFQWFNRWIENRVISAVESYLADEEVQKGLAEMMDQIVDRQIQRLYGKVGGTMKGVNAEIQGQSGIGNIFRRDGSLNFKGIIGMVLQNPTVLGKILNRGEPSNKVDSGTF